MNMKIHNYITLKLIIAFSLPIVYSYFGRSLDFNATVIYSIGVIIGNQIADRLIPPTFRS
jgi:sorbitol-specific phosphotransferase system component IIBC